MMRIIIAGDRGDFHLYYKGINDAIVNGNIALFQ